MSQAVTNRLLRVAQTLGHEAVSVFMTPPQNRFLYAGMIEKSELTELVFTLIETLEDQRTFPEQDAGFYYPEFSFKPSEVTIHVWREFRRHLPELQIVISSSKDQITYRLAFVENGAQQYRDIETLEQLLDTLARAVLEGNFFFLSQ